MPTSVANGQEALFFFFDHDGNLGRYIAMQPERNAMLAQRFDGLFEMNLAAVNMEILLFERVGNVFGCDRTE
jgi:hypothetical protein